jgi:hypothetical protein
LSEPIPHQIRLSLSICVAVSAFLWEPPSATADPQSATVEKDEQPDAESNSENYIGTQDITRPRNQLEIRTRFQTSGQPDKLTKQGRILSRLTMKISFSPGWRIGLLAEVPFDEKVTVTTKTSDSGVTSNSVTNYGVGDAEFQAYLAHDIDKTLAFAVGARGVGPSGSDAVGSGKWQVMPGVGLRYSFTDLGPNTYFTPVIRYALSVAGDPDRRNIRQVQFSPSFNIGIPDNWFVTLYPSYDIRMNFGPEVGGQKGRLFLPFDVAFGREVSKGVQMSLEISVPIIRDFPVYNFKTELKMLARF